MNICKKKTEYAHERKDSLNIIAGKYKVSVCDAGSILRHIAGGLQRQINLKARWIRSCALRSEGGSKKWLNIHRLAPVCNKTIQRNAR